MFSRNWQKKYQISISAVQPHLMEKQRGRVAGTVIMAMLAFVILLCGVAFFFGRPLGFKTGDRCADWDVASGKQT